MAASNANAESVRWRRITGIATTALAVIGAIGLYVVVDELQQLTRQNEYLERTLRQTYRPLGVATYSDTAESLIIVGLRSGPSPGRFSMSFERRLQNLGDGLLSYIGSFWHVSVSELDFRSAFLTGQIDTVMFDGMHNFARRRPVLPGKAIETKAHWDDLTYEKRYFVYTIFLYEDQDGGLYDTERLEVLDFEEPISGPEGLSPQLAEETAGGRETYHYYSADERTVLGSRLSESGHPQLAAIVEMD